MAFLYIIKLFSRSIDISYRYKSVGRLISSNFQLKMRNKQNWNTIHQDGSNYFSVSKIFDCWNIFWYFLNDRKTANQNCF